MDKIKLWWYRKTHRTIKT